MQRPSLAGIEDALRRVRTHQAETPLLRSELLSRALEADVWLKNETVSPIASFKLRGALTALLRAAERGPVQGVVTSSTGNHGQGVAYAARLLGVPAWVFLPISANPLKKSMIQAFGAQIEEVGEDLDAAKAVAIEFARERNLEFVDDGESLDVIEGAGSVGLEIARGLESIGTVFVPMGSGSLAGGCAAALKSVQPRVRVVAVQAKGSPAMVESFHAKRAVSVPAQTIADGLVCREPAALALSTLIELVDDAVALSDEDLLSAMRTIIESAHVLVEPSGAAALAAAWQARESLEGQRVVLVLTGANATAASIQRAMGMPGLGT